MPRLSEMGFEEAREALREMIFALYRYGDDAPAHSGPALRSRVLEMLGLCDDDINDQMLRIYLVDLHEDSTYEYAPHPRFAEALQRAAREFWGKPIEELAPPIGVLDTEEWPEFATPQSSAPAADRLGRPAS